MHAKQLFSVLPKHDFERIAFVTRPIDPGLLAFKRDLAAWLEMRGKETALEWEVGSCPMVIPGHTRVELIVRGEDGLGLALDGQHGVDLGPGDRIEVTRSERVTRMIRMPEASYYGLLAGKLGFGRGA
jgi:hypothetical protein